MRLALTLAAALAAAATSLGGPAAADSTCVDTTDQPFNGTRVCAATNTVILGYTLVPYSVGSVCVSTTCTTPVYGTIRVPRVNLNTVQLYGTVCYTPTPKSPTTCRTFDTADIWNLFESDTDS